MLTGWTPHVHQVSPTGSVSALSDCERSEITVQAGRNLETLVACIVP